MTPRARWDWSTGDVQVVRVVLRISYCGPTERTGARYSVTGGAVAGRSLRVLAAYEHALSMDERVEAAAQAWVDRHAQTCLRAMAIDRPVLAVALRHSLGTVGAHEVIAEISAADA